VTADVSSKRFFDRFLLNLFGRVQSMLCLAEFSQQGCNTDALSKPQPLVGRQFDDLKVSYGWVSSFRSAGVTHWLLRYLYSFSASLTRSNRARAFGRLVPLLAATSNFPFRPLILLIFIVPAQKIRRQYMHILFWVGEIAEKKPLNEGRKRAEQQQLSFQLRMDSAAPSPRFLSSGQRRPKRVSGKAERR
jgi:hypothetical protein